MIQHTDTRMSQNDKRTQIMRTCKLGESRQTVKVVAASVRQRLDLRRSVFAGFIWLLSPKTITKGGGMRPRRASGMKYTMYTVLLPAKGEPPAV